MLLEEDESSGDIFRCLVGNLPPGAEAAITFAYAIELKLSPDGDVVFVLPTQLNPRYNPSKAGFYICSLCLGFQGGCIGMDWGVNPMRELSVMLH